MKPLDEHLRDASNAWLQEARPTLHAAAEDVAKRLTPLTPNRYMVGGLGAVLVIASIWWLLSASGESPQPGSVTPSGVESRPHTQMPTSPSRTTLPPPSPLASPTATTTPVAVSQPVVAEETVSRTNRLVVDGIGDGFTAEYERVLGSAMRFESSDPLRAATEYLGLGRLCIARKQYAHAISALQRAEAIVGTGNYAQLSADIQRALDSCRTAMMH